VPSTACEPAELGCQIIKARLRLASESLTQNLTMLGFGRPAMPCCASFETQNQIIVEITNAEAAWHRFSSPSMMAMMADMARFHNTGFIRVVTGEESHFRCREREKRRSWSPHAAAPSGKLSC